MRSATLVLTRRIAGQSFPIGGMYSFHSGGESRCYDVGLIVGAAISIGASTASITLTPAAAKRAARQRLEAWNSIRFDIS